MRIFISGFGNIGLGFFETLLIKEAFLKKRFKDDPITVVGIVDSRSYEYNDGEYKICGFCTIGGKKNTGKLHRDRNGLSCREIMDMVDFDLLIEAGPTDITDGGEGLENIRHALRKGKDVITVNKGPLALAYSELSALAAENGCHLRFEGSVGGGMPIINLCNEALVGQKIISIQGIFNGTCNLILSRMDSGIPFEQALREAQQLGYAESDPTYDIKGIDAASKVTILANSVFNRKVSFSDVSVTGIDTVTGEAVRMAAEKGMVIRHIGEISKDKLEVAPRLIPRNHPLSVPGSLNKAQVITDMAGPITVSGRGAGKNETGSAMLSDLIWIMDRRNA